MNLSAVVGFVANKDEIFQQNVIEEINRRNHSGIKAEYCLIPEITLGKESPYRVIIDRLSPVIAYFREYLKTAALLGTYVINNPFRSVSERFFSYAVAEQNGIVIPKSVALPSKSWNDPALGQNIKIDTSDLGNLIYPLDWEKIIGYIGFPAIFKTASKVGRQDVYQVHNFTDLMQCYNRSEHQVMMLQEFIPAETFLRCFVLGKKHTFPLIYDAEKACYTDNLTKIDPLLLEKAKEEALKLNIALDHDMNCTEFAIHNDVLYAVDLVDLFLDITPERLPRPAYQWIIHHLADVAIEYAQSDKKIII